MLVCGRRHFLLPTRCRCTRMFLILACRTPHTLLPRRSYRFVLATTLPLFPLFYDWSHCPQRTELFASPPHTRCSRPPSSPRPRRSPVGGVASSLTMSCTLVALVCVRLRSRGRRAQPGDGARVLSHDLPQHKRPRKTARHVSDRRSTPAPTPPPPTSTVTPSTPLPLRLHSISACPPSTGATSWRVFGPVPPLRLRTQALTSSYPGRRFPVRLSSRGSIHFPLC